jgi:hypothetical protein
MGVGVYRKNLATTTIFDLAKGSSSGGMNFYIYFQSMIKKLKNLWYIWEKRFQVETSFKYNGVRVSNI